MLQRFTRILNRSTDELYEEREIAVNPALVAWVVPVDNEISEISLANETFIIKGRFETIVQQLQLGPPYLR